MPLTDVVEYNYATMPNNSRQSNEKINISTLETPQCLAKTEYYTDLFKGVNDCKPYWKSGDAARAMFSCNFSRNVVVFQVAGMCLRICQSRRVRLKSLPETGHTGFNERLRGK